MGRAEVTGGDLGTSVVSFRKTALQIVSGAARALPPVQTRLPSGRALDSTPLPCTKRNTAPSVGLALHHTQNPQMASPLAVTAHLPPQPLVLWTGRHPQTGAACTKTSQHSSGRACDWTSRWDRVCNVKHMGCRVAALGGQGGVTQIEMMAEPWIPYCADMTYLRQVRRLKPSNSQPHSCPTECPSPGNAAPPARQPSPAQPHRVNSSCPPAAHQPHRVNSTSTVFTSLLSGGAPRSKCHTSRGSDSGTMQSCARGTPAGGVWGRVMQWESRR